MTDFTQLLLPKIETHRLPGIPLDDDQQAPFYDGFCLANLPASICNWLGVHPLNGVPLDEIYTRPFRQEYDQVIQIVVDGMGLELFQKMSAEDGSENQSWQDLLAKSCIFPMTSIVPSTTSAALTAFWTGCTASQHGITGYEMWLREFNMAANMITHSPAFFDAPAGSLRQAGFDPLQFLTVPTLGPYFAKRGIESFVLQHNSLARSGLSAMLFPGAEMHPFRGMNDLFTTLEEIAGSEFSNKRFIYAYWGDLDELQHVYGPGDSRVGQEFHSFGRALSRFYSRMHQSSCRKTLIIVTADHGQKPTRISDDYRIQQTPELVRCLHLLPTGESRMPYLHIRPGFEAEVRQLVEQRWPGDFSLIRTADAVAGGLFGPGPDHPELDSRLGDLLLISRKDAYLYWPRKENTLHGRHGGLSRSEMLVPLMIFDC